MGSKLVILRANVQTVNARAHALALMLEIFSIYINLRIAMIDRRMVLFEQRKKDPARVRERGQVLVLVIIVLALIGGGYWYLTLSRRNAEKEAWTFAQEVAERIAVQHDRRFIDLNLSPSAQVAMPPSSRDQLFESIRNLGKPDGPVVLSGKVQFTSQFFDPKGVFHAQINYPGVPTYLDMSVSASKGPWWIDSLTLVSYPPRRD